jgi:hypothetical protein
LEQGERGDHDEHPQVETGVSGTEEDGQDRRGYTVAGRLVMPYNGDRYV